MALVAEPRFRRDACMYARDYCEENIWHLARNAQFAAVESYVVCMSNKERTCALWSQRASPAADQPVIWDYHVILIANVGQMGVFDLDSTLNFPTPILEYLDRTFGPAEKLPVRWQSRFRLVSRAQYIEGFFSDRKHMRNANGSWRSPPPEWDNIQSKERSISLEQLLDFEGFEPEKVLSLSDLRMRF